MSLEVGIKGTCTVTADESNSAKTMRSGTLDVFATPAMIALMEKTAWTSVAPYLEPGDRKSTRLNSSHWNKSRMPSSA